MELKFTDDLIPVVVVDHGSREVLMVAWANREAVDLTRSTGYAHY
ncbi:MAG: phosphoribosyl-AMP cyclohydrolase, partial [Methanomicrobia archaeon]|nr:phosphoribosyl-AMP cyclohydrolase [Methanomicrobia archaeon]